MSGRVQLVKVGNCLSTSVSVTSGVPQGSHLGPLLFNIFINDLADILTNTNFFLYADDLNVFRVIRGEVDAIDMQGDLHMLEQWCTINKMWLNTAMCVVLRASRSRSCRKYSYKLNDVTLNEVTEVMDLGVCITPCFDFRPHYKYCSRKAMRTMGFIVRFARHFRNTEFLRLLYVALVRPHVQYASAIWSPRHTKYIIFIERVQHKFLRSALRSLGSPMDRDDHDYCPGLTLFNIATLDDRRYIADMIFLFKVINGVIDCPDLFGVVAYNVPGRHIRTRPLFLSSLPKYH